jgi:hypothetical protein
MESSIIIQIGRLYTVHIPFAVRLIIHFKLLSDSMDH